MTNPAAKIAVKAVLDWYDQEPEKFDNKKAQQAYIFSSGTLAGILLEEMRMAIHTDNQVLADGVVSEMHRYNITGKEFDKLYIENFGEFPPHIQELITKNETNEA